MKNIEVNETIHVKAVGVIRCLDNQSRLMIPSELRKQFNFQSNRPVEIIGTVEGLLVRPVQSKE